MRDARRRNSSSSGRANRRRVWFGLFVAALEFGASSCGRGEHANVILIVVDDLRADHLSHAGYSRTTSPFLDELAAKSTRFENALSQSSYTKTSVASLFTSLHPEAHGVRGSRDVLPDSAQTLAEALKNHGYRTFAIHGNPWLEERFGFRQGFDRFRFTHWYKDTFDARKVNERALRWLDRTHGEPFFLYLHYMDVHSPWKPPQDFDRFGPHGVDKYDGSILYLDTRLKELFAALERRGLGKNTWIVFTSDHGEEFGERGNHKVGHGITLYREVLRVPLIFHHRKATPGKGVVRQVRLIDVAPTILDLLGIAIPEDMEGVSLKADVVGSARTDDDLDSLSQVGLNDVAPDKDLVALSTRKYKYILDFHSGEEELYDLIVDPGETFNLAPVQPDLASEYREYVLRFRKNAKRLGAAPDAAIDPELEEQLRSLGYLK